jgi:hypothetical protein
LGICADTLTACSVFHTAGPRAQKRSRDAGGLALIACEGSPQQHDSDLGTVVGLARALRSGVGILTARPPVVSAGQDWLADLGSPGLPTQHCTEAPRDPPLAHNQPQRAPERRAQPQEQLRDVRTLFSWPDSDEDGPQAAELHLGSESHGQRQWQQHSGDLSDDLLADLPTITWESSAGEASHRGGCLLRSTKSWTHVRWMTKLFTGSRTAD